VTSARRPPRVDLIVDSSAVIAIARSEAMAAAVEHALRSARAPAVSSATMAELTIVTRTRLGAEGVEAVRAVLDAAHVVEVPVDAVIARRALEAWERYGKGRDRAGLNFGDCLAYATAAHYDAPLLCVGDDFARTDLTLVDIASAGDG
jgi:ribonuclease VapC